jgi:hypothetical protein
MTADGVFARTRLLAPLGITISAFSVLVILGQWLPIVVCGVRMRMSAISPNPGRLDAWSVEPSVSLPLVIGTMRCALGIRAIWLRTDAQFYATSELESREARVGVTKRFHGLVDLAATAHSRLLRASRKLDVQA